MIPEDARIARFLARPNRFVLRCDLNGEVIDAYLPNPGRLWELLLPGCKLYLAKNRTGVKLPYTVVAMEKEGVPILLHTHLANDAAEILLRRSLVPGLEDVRILRREATFGDSRFDFLLEKDSREMVLEVKNCTLFGRTLAMFPDAVTKRGSRHLEGLMRLAASGVPAGVLFLVEWPHARYFMPEHHTDLLFSQTFLKCRDRILVEALALTWNADLSLDGAVRRLVIPWDRIERECCDRGCYILVLKLDEDTMIAVGGLGDILFRKGYYLYAGSAKRGLTKRMERHARTRKKRFWHIDYLREKASFHRALAVRTERDIECVIAAGLKRISRWYVPGFGCSDCSCASHLFGMDTDPMDSPDFISLVYDHRIGSIEKELEGEHD